MLRTGRIALVLAVLAAPLASACRSGSGYDTDGEADGPVSTDVTLLVKNENILSVDVFAYSGGIAKRIGRVTGLSSGKFTLNPTLYVSSDFRLLATPTSGTARASSGTLQLHAGQTVEFVIGSRMEQSRASVREP